MTDARRDSIAILTIGHIMLLLSSHHSCSVQIGRDHVITSGTAYELRKNRRLATTERLQSG
jgi:hypothetical protein